MRHLLQSLSLQLGCKMRLLTNAVNEGMQRSSHQAINQAVHQFII
jgi:hypothetical protein